MTFFRSRDGAEVGIVVPAGGVDHGDRGEVGLTIASDFSRGIASLKALDCASRSVPPRASDDAGTPRAPACVA
jgi:hypothetical protein